MCNNKNKNNKNKNNKNANMWIFHISKSSRINYLSGKRKSKDNVWKDVYMIEKQSKYMERKKKSGEGIRKYKQPKRNAYNINYGQYGGLLIMFHAWWLRWLWKLIKGKGCCFFISHKM